MGSSEALGRFNQETKREDTIDFKDLRGIEDRAPGGWAEVTKSIQCQRNQAEVCCHPETRTMPLGPFWKQPRDGDLQGSGCGWESRGVPGHGLLQGGTSGLDCDGTRVDDSSQSRKTLLGGVGGLEGGSQEATMVQEAWTSLGRPHLLWAGLGHGSLPVPSPPSPWPSRETHGDLFSPPHHPAPITADR